MIVCRRVPVLDVDVYYINSREDAIQFVLEHDRYNVGSDAERVEMTTCQGCCRVAEDASGKKHRMLCVFEGGLNTLAHESVHMAWILMRYCAIKADAKNEEPMAYVAAWLTSDMWATMAIPDTP